MQNALTGIRFTSDQGIKNWLDSFLAAEPLKLVQPCWPEVGPTSEMITLSVHWREQLARRRVPVMGRPRSKYTCTRVENKIRALAGPDKVYYLISTLLVRY